MITETVATLPPRARKKEIPYLVSWILLGANIHEKFEGGDGWALELGGEFRPVSKEDLDLAVRVAATVSPGNHEKMVSGKRLLEMHKAASTVCESIEVPQGRRIVMLKDKGGAGYWRMVLPTRYMEKAYQDVSIDVTGGELKFEYLLEYEVIMVQRLMDWRSFYVLERLKKAGKRIVYDIDDDIFSLTPNNPAFHVISRDNQTAAAACMKLADAVTVTTEVLQSRIAQVTGVSPIVIPNALDTSDRWLPTEKTGSPDGNKRIFWQGSSTHAADWEVCIAAVDRIMAEHKNVRLVLLGFLPPVVIERLSQPHWKGKVEHVGFSDPETYFEIIHHVRAEVGIAPIAPEQFNEAKSPIKWLEATLIGMPVVASDMEPYSSVIEHGVNGSLVKTQLDWHRELYKYITMKPDERRAIVAKAREVAEYAYDIKRVVEAWREVLLPA